MRRKDCHGKPQGLSAGWCSAPGRAARAAAATAIMLCAAATPASAGTIRLWSSAVVVDDAVRLSDLCELVGFSRETEQRLGSIPVTASPIAGGSRLVHMDMVRSALEAGGANMARVTLRGSTRCTVTRPLARVGTAAGKPGAPAASTSRRGNPSSGETGPESQNVQSGTKATLKDAVLRFFNAEFARYGGRADVAFDRSSDDVLALSGSAYTFKVRRRGGSPLGLAPLEVDVISDGLVVQTVSMVVQVSMVAKRVVAKRPINQGATVKAADVSTVSVVMTRLDKLGFDDAAQVVGQRAKKFLPTGTLLVPEMLESVPLVRRGDLVKLTSVAGAVQVISTVRAAADGSLGDIITVRAADNKRVELDAVVVGPGLVRIGAANGASSPATALVQGGRR